MAKDIMTNSELIESLILDLNNSLKEITSGQYINFCSIVYQMAQKLINLRNTIDNDLKNREQTIETLKEELRNAGHEVNDMTQKEFVEEFMNKDGAE